MSKAYDYLKVANTSLVKEMNPDDVVGGYPIAYVLPYKMTQAGPDTAGLVALDLTDPLEYLKGMLVGAATNTHRLQPLFADVDDVEFTPRSIGNLSIDGITRNTSTDGSANIPNQQGVNVKSFRGTTTKTVSWVSIENGNLDMERFYDSVGNSEFTLVIFQSLDGSNPTDSGWFETGTPLRVRVYFRTTLSNDGDSTDQKNNSSNTNILATSMKPSTPLVEVVDYGLDVIVGTAIA